MFHKTALLNEIENLVLHEKKDEDDSQAGDGDFCVDDGDEDIKQVAGWIRESQDIVILSGAGVSCSADIPDFRTVM